MHRIASNIKVQEHIFNEKRYHAGTMDPPNCMVKKHIMILQKMPHVPCEATATVAHHFEGSLKGGYFRAGNGAPIDHLVRLFKRAQFALTAPL